MNTNTTNIYELFEFLQHEIAWNYKKVHSASRYATENLSFQSGMYPISLTLSWMLFCGLIVANALNDQNLSQRIPGVVSEYFFYSVSLGFSGLAVANFYQWHRKERVLRFDFVKDDALYVFLFAFLVPVILSISLHFATIALGRPVENSGLLGFIVGMAVGLNVTAFSMQLLFAGFVLPFLPVILSSVMLDDLSNARLANHLSYDVLIRKTAENCYSFIVQHPKDTIKNIQLIAERKHEHLSAHVQTLSPSLGAFGLFGLLAITASQEQVQSLLKGLEDFVFRLLLINIRGTISVVGAVLVLILVLLSSVYFYRVYLALRVLEILIVLCEMRLINIKREEKMLQDTGLLIRLSNEWTS